VSERTFSFATEETYLRRADEKHGQRERGILTFVVGGEVHGIEILSIREIIKPREITEVPRAPRFLLGILTVRGLVMPVIDLRLRLRLPAPPLGPRARVLVVVHEGERFGLVVDEVRDVVRFSDAAIEPPPPAFAARVDRELAQEAQFLSGIGRYHEEGAERMVVLLSLSSVLAFEVQA
jgi:purine-binding chemotaxis protein CheW